MNRVHGLICSSGWWARTVRRELLPWGLGAGLEGAGLREPKISTGGRSFRFRAVKPL